MISTRSVQVFVIAILVSLSAPAIHAAHRVIADRATIEKTDLPKATAGLAAGKRNEKLKVDALFPDTMLAGVVTTRDGRIFMSFPRWNDVDFSAAELTKDGKLAPVPNLALHQTSDGERLLVSIQGLDVDANGRLWMLDATNAKLHCVDLSSRTIVKTLRPSNKALGTSTYANDVRIDLRRGSE